MANQRALSGIRVLDLTWVRAGPWGTRLLGALGAEVIKVEWPAPGSVHYTDRVNAMALTGGGVQGLNNNLWFSEKNVNKLSVTLNMRTPRGLDLAKRLLAISDIVAENFTSRVLESWGLGYREMVKIKPDIVYVSMSSLGHTGRNHGYRTFGPSAQALAGQTFLSGLPDESPAGWGWSYLDDTGGMYGAMCMLTALHHRNVTGRGQHVDMSQVAAGVTLTGAAVLDRTVNGRPARREGYPPGNRTHWPGTPLVNNYRGPTVAPHNAYRTAGDDFNDWCAIACFSDEEWRRLVEVMGSPAWAADPRFASPIGRLEHQAELDAGIEAWTRTLDKYEAAARCQAVGVRAMPVQSSADRVERDPQLAERDMFVELPHAVMGPRIHQQPPFRSSAAETGSWSAAPLVGEHNEQVYCGILGLTDAELRSGYADGTFWPLSLPPEPYLPELVEVRAGAGEKGE